MIFNSIRAKLLIWLAFLLVCILAGFGVTVFGLQRKNRLNQIDQELEHRLAAVNSDAQNRETIEPFKRPAQPQNIPDSGEQDDLAPDSPDRPVPAPFNPRNRKLALSPQTLRMFNEADPDDFYYSVWSRDADLLKRSANAPVNLTHPERPGPDTLIHFRMRGMVREAFHFTDFGECTLVGVSLAAESAAQQQFGLWLVLIGGAVLAIGLGGVWWFVNRAIRPVETISATAQRIAAGNLSERIKVKEDDSELGKLAGVLNSTFARLDAAFTQQKHFTADASHELRTPISVLISEAQTTLARERTTAEYRETVEACLDTAQQMRSMMESLLELARFDANQEKMARSRFNLAEKVRSSVELVHPLADEKGIEIQCHLPNTEIMGDADRISQVVVNLIINSIRYNRDGGKIGVTLHPAEDTVELTISDTGSGITPADLPHVFERFYRADKARSGGTGGSGLGLAICKAIVEAHGGSILVSSKPGLGSLFMVRLPLLS
ncbi:MAG TPA: ATP-binding protein [Verrucomicrobiae bacterium]|nr:ATP-binding protein [Verrucomicrobiae bacterium]